MKDALLELGIRIQDSVAGFAGGVVNAFLMKRSDLTSILSSVVVGAFTANYLADSIAKTFNIGNGFAGFGVGLCAVVICQKLIDFGKQWKPGGSGDVKDA